MALAVPFAITPDGIRTVSEIPLSEAPLGSLVTVTATCGQSPLGLRLMELGFIPGARVEVVRRAPFSGPVQYRVQGVSVSMRPDEARCVSVVASKAAPVLA